MLRCLKYDSYTTNKSPFFIAATFWLHLQNSQEGISGAPPCVALIIVHCDTLTHSALINNQLIIDLSIYFGHNVFLSCWRPADFRARAEQEEFKLKPRGLLLLPPLQSPLRYSQLYHTCRSRSNKGLRLAVDGYYCSNAPSVCVHVCARTDTPWSLHPKRHSNVSSVPTLQRACTSSAPP